MDQHNKAEEIDAIIDDIVAIADEIETISSTWARTIQELGIEHGATIRRKAYELNLKLRT